MDVLVYAETPEVAQKKVLLCLLAEREAARRGIEISDAEVQAEADQFRRAFGLTDADDTTNWMDSVGLDLEGFTRFMRAFATVRVVQADLGSEIESLLGTFMKVESARRRTGER